MPDLWSAYDTALAVLPIAAIVAWMTFAIVSAIAGDRRTLVDAMGWTATTLTSLAILPYFSIVVGFLLFLPALWFNQTEAPGAVPVVAWAEALLLSVAVVAVGRWSFRRFGRARFLSAGVVVLGLGSVWMGRFLATVDWSLGPG